KPLIIHNAAFDLAFLARLGFVPASPVHDVMLMSRLLTAGDFEEKNDLAACASRELGVVLDKSYQRSDWSGELTDGQLSYAAIDAEVLTPLRGALAAKLGAAGLTRVAEIETRALQAFFWLARSGVAFDRPAWDELTREADEAAKALSDR